MNINNYDPTINNSMFLSKVDNIFILLYTGIMFDDLNRVKHKMTPELFEKYKEILDENNSKNVRQMYDELNVKTSSITNITKTEDKIIVKVMLICRYMNYLVDKTTLKFKSGNDDTREEHTLTLALEKRTDAKDIKVSMHCPACGSPANVNAYGVCPYCGTRFNTEDFDYILTNIE
jgi:predicted lipid-binding transport protein (Tim44 family)